MSNPYEQFLQAKIGNLPLNRGVSFDEFENARLNGLLKSLESNPQLMNNMSNVSQQINQEQIDKNAKEQKRKERRQALEDIAARFGIINAQQSGNYQQANIMQNNLLERQQERRLKIEQDQFVKDNPEYAEMIKMKQLFGFTPPKNNQQTYRPELKTYKNNNSENLNIAGIILKPGEERSLNIANPNIANALMNTSGITEVSNEVPFSRVGALYSTNDGPYREIVSGNQQIFSGVGGQLSNEQFFAKYPDARTTTTGEGYRYIPDLKTFNTINKDLVAIEKSMFQLENYWKNVKDSNIGLERLGDQISQWFKTLAGSENLTPEELYRALAEGRLQGLIGANRIDTVGGGVMTEKDAWRVIARLGGDVNALQNPAVVGPQLQEMYELKVFDYNEQIKSYNNAVETNNFKGYKKRDPISNENITNIFSMLPSGIPAGSVKVQVGNQTLYQDGSIYYAVLPDGSVVEVDIDG